MKKSRAGAKAALRIGLMRQVPGKRIRIAYLLAGSRNGAGVPSGAGMRNVSRIMDTMT